MPEKLVVGREDAAIVHIPRGLEQGRAGTLHNHLCLLREGRRQLAPVRAARQIEIDICVAPSRKRGRYRAENACALKETTTIQRADQGLRDTDGVDLSTPVGAARSSGRPAARRWSRSPQLPRV
jgi:hypothetical protein